jgi:hypothetical protein
MKYVLIPLTFVFLFSACRSNVVQPGSKEKQNSMENSVNEPLQRDLTAPFQTDQLHYTLVLAPDGLQGEIPYVFNNPTQSPVYIVNCNGFTRLALEKRMGEYWVKAWEPIMEACLSEPVVVQPEQAYRAVIHVFGAHPANDMYPKFSVDSIPGVYRLVWQDVLQTYDPQTYPFGDALPLEQRISNHFRLDVQ